MWDGYLEREAGIHRLRARKGRYKEASMVLWRTVMADSKGWVRTLSDRGTMLLKVEAS